jgi:hypothetical protein
MGFEPCAVVEWTLLRASIPFENGLYDRAMTLCCIPVAQDT